MGLFLRKKTDGGEPVVRPKHIAIIMDGNGRWAKKRGLPRLAGHRAGSETVRRVLNWCRDANIRYLTLYAFSTENWRRPQEEVSGLMKLLEGFIEKNEAELLEKKRLDALKEMMKYSLIIISSIPVLVIYPFVQKHFVKGVMIGSVKG